MKSVFFAALLLVFCTCAEVLAQPFLQLIPRGMYKEDVNYSGSDWAGFYRTSQYDETGNLMMVIIPTTADSVAGFGISENLQYIRILDGKMKGNGITYNYKTIDLKKKFKLDNPEGEGFMVMKDDGEKENVYCKHGHSSGISEQKGCFSAGRKKPVVLKNGDQTGNYDWSGNWNMEARYDNAILKLDRVGRTYIGYYTLKDFKYSESKTSAWAMNFNKTTTTTWTFPESTVLVMGIPYGDCLYFVELHRDGERMGAGYLQMSADKNSLSGPHISNEKIKNLEEKGTDIIKCRR
ncbi:MAG: hypothetical protein AB9842_00645 [Bacteroidales bacterium]